MTDNELLELAAKAAGYVFVIHTGYDEEDGVYVTHTWVREPGCLVEWNPLTDDGDALRLAVKLHMFDGTLFERFMAIRLEETRLNPARSDEEITRRAIVRAAASIGKEI